MLGVIMLGVAIILIVYCSMPTNRDSHQNRRNIVMLAFVLITLVMGCRNALLESGSDLNNYYKLYERAMRADNIATFMDLSNMEKGYMYLNWILAKIIRWPQFIIFFQAAFCCGVTLRFIYKYSQDILFSILGFMSLGIMQFYLTGFRQGLAMAICLLAYEMAEKSKLFRFVLLVLVAMTIHQTAIIFFLVYIIMRMKVNRLFVLFDIVMLFFVSRYIPELIKVGNDIFEREYSGVYFGNNLGGIITLTIGGFTILLLLYRVKQSHITNQSMIHVLIWGMGIYALRFEALVLERISLYFTPTLFILLPEAIQRGFIYRDRKIVKVLFVGVMMFLMVWRLKNIDYITFWM